MLKITSGITYTNRAKTEGLLTGSVLRLREDEPLWPATLAAEVLTLDLASRPEGIREMIDANLLPESCLVTIRPIDVIRLRQRWSSLTGVSQRAHLRSRDVKIID